MLACLLACDSDRNLNRDNHQTIVSPGAPPNPPPAGHLFHAIVATRCLHQHPSSTARRSRIEPHAPPCRSFIMAPALGSRAAIVARSDSLSPGGIAGAVVGSVIGGTLAVLVLLFLYFRYRRRNSFARGVNSPSASHHGSHKDRRTSLSGQPGGPAPDRPASLAGTTWDRGDPAFAGSWQSDAGQDANFTPDTNYPYPIGLQGRTPTQHAAAASYYDMTIAMDSDPNLPAMAPPSRYHEELYQRQLEEARKARRKDSKGSAFSRIFGGLNNFGKRKRSTRSSIAASPITPSAPQPDKILPTTEGGGSAQLYAEPEEMAEESGTDKHHAKRSRQDDLVFPGQSGRVDSMNTERAEQTPDPELPSSAFDHKSPLSEAHSTTSPYAPERLQSPEIPEPMDLNPGDITQDQNYLRGSYSPQLPPDNFVVPMDVLQPTNETEKAAHTNAALGRLASGSPVRNQPVPPTSPDADSDLDMDEEEDGSESEIEGYPTLKVPSAGSSRDGPSDYSTPGGQTSTVPSSARTPDTRITLSPSPAYNGIHASPGSAGMGDSASPFNHVFIKPESSLSPESHMGSPEQVYTCDDCHRTFNQLHKLNHHKRYHDRKHECHYPGCDKKFGTKTHLDRHINDKHEKTKGFHCPEPGCPYFNGGKVFPRKDNWRRHMQNKHNVNPTYEPEPVG